MNILLQHCHTKKVTKGMTLSNQNPASLFFVLSGKLRVTTEVGRERPLIIGDYGSRELVCVDGVFGDTKPYTVKVIESGNVAIISYEKLKYLMWQNDVLALLSTALAKEHKKTQKQWIDSLTASAYDRVKDHIEEIPGTPHPDGVQKKIKCYDIADSLGLTRESVGKKLTELQKNNVIRRNGQSFDIVVLT